MPRSAVLYMTQSCICPRVYFMPLSPFLTVIQFHGLSCLCVNILRALSLPGKFLCCFLFAFAIPLSPDIHIGGTFSCRSSDVFRKASLTSSIQNRGSFCKYLYIRSVHLTYFVFFITFTIWICIHLLVQ